ncbi:MAG: type II secretion system protein [Candidatus Omnitrophica bacterium]|nr:type II secretion system protein [Candidatus Omnitrophota bacterium]
MRLLLIRLWRVKPRSARGGFTLPEVLIGVAILAIAVTAFLGAFLGQMILAEHARNLTWAINDANRVMEQLRLQNTSPTCATLPSDDVPAATGQGTCTDPLISWDDWLQRCGGGKSLQPNPLTEELMVVTCQNEAGTVACGSGDDPIRLTVSVCWRHRNRTLGECAWDGTTLTSSEGSNGFAANGVIESPATLATLMTCRT